MAAVSQNGWPVLVREQLHWFNAGGGRFAGASEDVATIGAYLIDHYDFTVETVQGPVLDDWSWASRPVRGQSTGYSNHASATAWDLNALAHGRGRRGTLSAAKVTALRVIYRQLKTWAGGVDVLRWGGDYVVSPKDEMHHEIVTTAAVCARVATAIREAKHMELTDSVTLSAAAAKAMGRAKGDEVSVSYLLQWGGPAVQKLQGQITALTATVQALAKAQAATSPAGVKAAFAAGVADLQAQLAAVDVHVTLGDDA
jgi:hypothetical protein